MVGAFDDGFGKFGVGEMLMISCSQTRPIPLPRSSQKAHSSFEERCCKILRAGKRPNLKLVPAWFSTDPIHERQHFSVLGQ